jgi:hypothetical protein
MVMNGPALEKKQSLLFRCVDVGAELFAQIATCVRARRDAKAHPGVTSYEELADLFCMQSRRRIAELFRGVGSNDDAAAYKLARAVLDGKFAWLEEGIIPAPTEAPASATHTAPQPAAAGTSN